MSGALAYPVQLHQRPGGFLVTFPDLEDARTSGPDERHALAEAVDCLRAALAARMLHGEEIPSPSEPSADARLVRVPAEVAAKLIVYVAFLRSGLTKSQLAVRLDVDESEVRRILDPRHRTKLGRLEQAADALGTGLYVGRLN